MIHVVEPSNALEVLMPGSFRFGGRALLVALALTGVAGASMPARAADTTPFEMYSIQSLTGFGAFLGKAQQDTLQRLETSINRSGGIKGRPIHFNFFDDQTNPQVAVQLVNAILTKNTSVLVGPGLTAPCLAVMPLVQGKMVQWCASPGIHPDKTSYSFSASVSTTDLVKAFVRYFRGRGMTRLAVLFPTDATGQDADKNLAEVLALPENKDIKLVAHEYMTNSDLSVAAQISKIKAANPQALIAWTIGTPTGTVLHGLNDAGLDIPVALSNANMTFPAMKQWASFLPKDLYFPGAPFLAGVMGSAQQRVAIQQFLDVTKGQGVQPDFQTGLIWDPAVLMITALRALGPDANATQIRDYIDNIHDFAGIAGVYDFRDGSHRGLSQKDVLVMRWDAAKNNWIAVSKLGGTPESP
jgi:branched-chain amino acid transport system substrate-binding protein